MAKQRNDRQKAAQYRLKRAWEMRARGYTQDQIGDELGISQQAVSKLLGQLDRAARADLIELASNEKICQHDRLNWMISEFCRAWERSKEPIKRAVRRTNESGEEATTLETVERLGNGQHLRDAMSAMKDIRSLLGLDVQAAANDPEMTMAAIITRFRENQAAHEADEAANPTPEVGRPETSTDEHSSGNTPGSNEPPPASL